MTRFLPVSLVAVTIAGVALAARQAPARNEAAAAKSGTVTGVVLTDTAEARPLVRATVRLTGAGATVRVVGTDDRGRFVFEDLPVGRFTVMADKAGFVRGFYGSTDPGRGPGVPVAVADGQAVDIRITLLPAAAITGTITDVGGRPAATIPIAATNVHPAAGLAPTSVQGVTDDRGIYRLYGLPPGEYVVSALPRITSAAEERGESSGAPITLVTESDVQWAKSAVASASAPRAPDRPEGPPRPVAYAPVFYPGTTNLAGVATIRVGSGEERQGVDMALQIVALAHVAGTLSDASGQPIPTAQVFLVPKRGDQSLPFDGLVGSGALLLPRAIVSASRFMFTGVAPGQYTLVARTGSGQRAAAEAAAGTLWSVTDLAMTGGDRDDFTLRLLPGLAVTGRVVFETNSATLVNPTSINLYFMADDPLPGVAATYRAAVERDGSFRVPSLAPGTYSIRADLAPAAPAARWLLKSALVDGHDLADHLLAAAAEGSQLSGLVVTFSDRAAEISGRLIDASGQPVTRYSVVAFPQDPSLWSPNSRRIRVARPATDGAFAMTGLPSGDYAVVAVEHAEDATLSDSAFLAELLRSAIKVTLAEGERKQQDLRTGQ